MFFDAPEPPKLWVPPRPAIVRAAPEDLQKLSYGPQGMMGLLGGRKPPSAAAIAYTNGAMNRTYAGQSFGASGPKSVAVVVWGSTSVGIPSAGVVGGVSATKLVEENTSNHAISIWIAHGVTAASGSIVLTISESNAWSAIQTYAVYDLTQTSAHDTASASSFSVSGLDVAKNGLVIAAVHGLAPSGSRSYTFPAGFSEGRDGNITLNYWGSSAVRAYEAAQTGMTLSVTESTTSSSVKVMAAVSLR